MLPLWGELNTTGDRHSKGSITSKGGSSSASTGLFIANRGPFSNACLAHPYISTAALLCQDGVAVHPIFTGCAANGRPNSKGLLPSHDPDQSQDSPGRRRQRHAPVPGQGAGERGV